MVRGRLRLPDTEPREPAAERAPDCGQEEVVHCPQLPEPNLVLAGVDIDVHLGRVHGEEQDADRFAPRREPALQCDPHRVPERAIPDRASVEEEVLPGRAPRTDPAAQVHPVRSRVHRCRRRRESAPHDLVCAFGAESGPEDDTPLVAQAERDVGAGKSETAHRLDRMLELGTLSAQEPPPGRNVVEEVPDLDGGPERMADGLRNVTILPDPPAGLLAARAGRDGEPGHRRDAGERLAPESEARHPEQVFRGFDLARRVAFEREGEVLAPDPAPVVGDPQGAGAAHLELDRHRARPRIQAVLEELLDHR